MPVYNGNIILVESSDNAIYDNICNNRCCGLADSTISAGVIRATVNAKQLYINRVIRIWDLGISDKCREEYIYYAPQWRPSTFSLPIRGTLLINRTLFKIANKVGRQ